MLMALDRLQLHRSRNCDLVGCGFDVHIQEEERSNCSTLQLGTIIHGQLVLAILLGMLGAHLPCGSKEWSIRRHVELALKRDLRRVRMMQSVIDDKSELGKAHGGHCVVRNLRVCLLGGCHELNSLTVAAQITIMGKSGLEVSKDVSGDT